MPAKLHRFRRLERRQTDFRHIVRDSSHLEYELYADVHWLRRHSHAVETDHGDTAAAPRDPRGFSHDDRQIGQLDPDLVDEKCRTVHRGRRLARCGRDQGHMVDREAHEHDRV